MDIKQFNFDEATLTYIKGVEVAFKLIAEDEGSEMTLNKWIEDNTNQNIGMMKSWTEKECYLYALGIISGIMSERIEIEGIDFD